MLAFLPTIPAPPRGDIPPEPGPREGGSTAAVLVSLIAFCALLAPVGWAAWPRGSSAARRASTASVTAGASVPPADDCASRSKPASPPSEGIGPCFILLPR